MERTRSAAVLTIGALALATLLAPPAAADEREAPEPFGRCDVYRPAGGAMVDGVDRCVTGLAPAGATVELPEPACPEAVAIPAQGGVEFYVGDCQPAHAGTTGAAATAEPAPAPPPPPPTTVPARPAPAAAPATTVAPTSTTVPAATSTTFVAPPPPAPSGGASTARPTTAEVVTDPAASVRLTSIGRPAESDHSPLVMLFALALVSLVLLGISRTRAERR